MNLTINHTSTSCRPGEYNLSFPVLAVQINASGRVELPKDDTVSMKFNIPEVKLKSISLQLTESVYVI